MINKEAKSLYIHIPFCKSKCRYCDFPSYSGKEHMMEEYVDALCIEIKKNKDFVYKTVFIGGGTPTFLSYECIKKLKNAVKELNLTEDVEFTVEGNPGTFTREKLMLFKEMGANRLSMGLQAFQNNLLKRLGRIHTVEVFIESLSIAREVGFHNINVDLMFGLPGQTVKMWKESLDKAAELNLEHISAYSLIIEEGTPFYEEDLKGLLDIPDEEDEREMYTLTKEFLRDRGYMQYEISNYALEDKECKHNIQYWDLGEYIGCGAGAHSYLNNIRKSNCGDIDVYIKGIKSDDFTYYNECENSVEDNIEEFMFMGLRKMKGVNLEIFKKRFKQDVNEIYKDVIDKYTKLNLLELEGDFLRLTSKGVEISNSVMSEFILDK